MSSRDEDLYRFVLPYQGEHKHFQRIYQADVRRQITFASLSKSPGERTKAAVELLMVTLRHVKTRESNHITACFHDAVWKMPPR